MPDGKTITIKPAKGRPMLTWVGKRPLHHVTAYPAQLVEVFAPLPSPPPFAPLRLQNANRGGSDHPSPVGAVSDGGGAGGGVCSFTATTKTCWLIC